MLVRRFIVWALERACCLTHPVPGVYLCNRLAHLSSELDERWGTRVWHTRCTECGEFHRKAT